MCPERVPAALAASIRRAVAAEFWYWLYIDCVFEEKNLSSGPCLRSDHGWVRLGPSSRGCSVGAVTSARSQDLPVGACGQHQLCCRGWPCGRGTDGEAMGGGRTDGLVTRRHPTDGDLRTRPKKMT